MFINLLKKSFLDVVKNPIITLLLVSYFIIISMLAGCLRLQSNMLIWYMLAFTSFLFVAIFMAGWFRVIKEISLKNPEEEKESSYIAKFLEGIGENVIPYSVGIFIYAVISMIFVYIAFLISTKLYGNPQEIIMKAQASADIKQYMDSLSSEEMAKLYAFPISFIISTTFCMFLFMYYFPSMIFSEVKNLFAKPFVALKDNFCFLFKHFFKSVGIYIVLCFINITAVLIKHLYLPGHVLVDILYLFYVIYFLSFAVMLICNYYGQNYSCNNRPDSLGENKSDDSAGEED